MFKKVKGMCKQIRTDIRGAVDIGEIVTLVITAMVGAIILGALLPTLSDNLGSFKDAAPELTGLINLLPMLIALIFVVGIVFVLVEMFKKKT